jgi:hypothetical protein
MFVKSAFGMCLTPFGAVFTLEGSFAKFTEAKNIYLGIFSSLSKVDPLDIFLSEAIQAVSVQRFLLNDAISIRAVFLIDAQVQIIEALQQSLTISNINKMLPANMAKILSISVYGVQISNYSMLSNSTASGNNQSVNVFQESIRANPQPNIGLFVGVGLTVFILIGCSTYIILKSGRCRNRRLLCHTVRPTTRILQDDHDNEPSVCVSVSVPEDIPGVPCQKDLRIEADDSPISFSLAADVAHRVLGHNSQPMPAGASLSDPSNPVNENVKHIDYSEIVIAAEISQGSFKSVFRATWNSPPAGLSREGGAGITVALLVLRQGGGMAREIEVFEKLGCHPHLTKLLAITTNQCGCQCLVTEYAALGSLDHVLHDFADRHMQISDLVLLTACMQICDGMEVLIEHQLIHRDLAARNVLVFKFHENNKRSVLVKITDYGLTVAGSYVQLSTSSVNCGVPIRWMPPEASPICAHAFC